MTKSPHRLPVLFEVITDDTTRNRLVSAYAISAMTRRNANKKYVNMHPNKRELIEIKKHMVASFNKAQVMRRELWMSDATLMALNVIKRLSKAKTIEEVLAYVVQKEFKALGFADLNTVSKNIEDIHRNHLVALGYSHKIYDLIVKAVVFAVYFIQIERVTNIWIKLKPLMFVGFPEVYFYVVDWLKGGRERRHKQRESFRKSSLRNQKKVERAEENEKIRARRFEEIYERGGSAFERYCEDPYLYSSYDATRRYKLKILRIAQAFRAIWSGLSTRYIAPRTGAYQNSDGKLEAVVRRKKIREAALTGGLSRRDSEGIQGSVQENISVESATEFETDFTE